MHEDIDRVIARQAELQTRVTELKRNAPKRPIAVHSPPRIPHFNERLTLCRPIRYPVILAASSGCNLVKFNAGSSSRS
jgi:hypothetical protein